MNAAQEKINATRKPVTLVLSEEKGTSGLKSITLNPGNLTVFTQTHENISVTNNFSASDFVR
jgi:hypothetical protein